MNIEYDIIVAWLEGDDEAADRVALSAYQLVESVLKWGKIRKFFHLKIPGDLKQEGILSLCKVLKKIGQEIAEDGPTPEIMRKLSTPYLAQVVHNGILTYIRRHLRETCDGELPELSLPPQLWEDTVFLSDLVKIFEVEDLQIIFLKCLGFSIKEIRNTLSLPKHRVENRLASIRRKLRETIFPDEVIHRSLGSP